MTWLLDQLWALLQLLLLITFVIWVTSPLETLGWWAGWSQQADHAQEALPPPSDSPQEGPFLVYFTGVAGFSGDFLSRREHGFLERLHRRIPGLITIEDVFPFSASNNPLDGDRLLRWLWSWLHRWRLKLPNNIFDVLIVIRNVAQVLVSADPRYGPVYNLGVAREVSRRLLERGYEPGRPVHLLAYSGGAQICVGIAPYLKENLRAEVRLIGLGPVFTDDPGILSVDSCLAILGDTDNFITGLGKLFYPGRWRMLRFSAWNRWLDRGLLRIVRSGPMWHVGRRDYFSRSALLPNGTPYAERCAELVSEEILRGESAPRGPEAVPRSTRP